MKSASDTDVNAQFRRTLLPLVKNALYVLGDFFGLFVGGSLNFALFGHWLSVLGGKRWSVSIHIHRCSDITYVSFVPLAEGGSIDLDDGALNEGVGSDELIVRCVVDLQKPESQSSDQ